MGSFLEESGSKVEVCNSGEVVRGEESREYVNNLQDLEAFSALVLRPGIKSLSGQLGEAECLSLTLIGEKRKKFWNYEGTEVVKHILEFPRIAVLDILESDSAGIQIVPEEMRQLDWLICPGIFPVAYHEMKGNWPAECICGLVESNEDIFLAEQYGIWINGGVLLDLSVASAGKDPDTVFHKLDSEYVIGFLQDLVHQSSEETFSE